MKALVIYDSNFGNTKRIAETIAEKLGEGVRVLQVSDFSKKEIEGNELLVVGSPVNGWRPTEKINKFLEGFSNGQLEGIKAAAFDTKFKNPIAGNASKRISKSLKEAGAEIVAKPQSFFVKGSKGPLTDGEIEKAAKWAASITNRY